MRTAWARLTRDESGVSAVEYAMIGVLISIAGFAALLQIGGAVNTMFTQIANGF